MEVEKKVKDLLLNKGDSFCNWLDDEEIIDIITFICNSKHHDALSKRIHIQEFLYGYYNVKKLMSKYKIELGVVINE